MNVLELLILFMIAVTEVLSCGSLFGTQAPYPNTRPAVGGKGRTNFYLKRKVRPWRRKRYRLKYAIEISFCSARLRAHHFRRFVHG